MKRLPLFLTAGVLAIAAAAPFAQNVFASTSELSPEETSRIYASRPSEYPLGERVVITVDPEYTSKPVFAGSANIITGFDAPDAVQGILVEEKQHWLVLREGKIEKWIPKSKILLMSFYD